MKGGLATSGDVWDTSEQGISVYGFQFNADTPRSSGAYLRFRHQRCEAYDICVDKAHEGIVLGSVECKVYRCKGLTSNDGNGSCVVSVQGSRCYVSHTDFTNFSGNFPESIVRVNGEAGDLETVTVENTHGDTEGTGVLVEVGHGNTVANLNIDGVVAERASDGVQDFLTGGGEISGVTVSNVVVDGGVRCVNGDLNGSGDLRGATITGVSGYGLTDTIVRFSNSGSGKVSSMSMAAIQGNATLNGIYVSGSGAVHENISIASAMLESSGDGLEAHVDGLSVSGLVTVSDVGVRLVPGCDNVKIDGVYKGSGSSILNNSGGSNVDVSM